MPSLITSSRSIARWRPNPMSSGFLSMPKLGAKAAPLHVAARGDSTPKHRITTSSQRRPEPQLASSCQPSMMFLTMVGIRNNFQVPKFVSDPASELSRYPANPTRTPAGTGVDLAESTRWHALCRHGCRCLDRASVCGSGQLSDTALAIQSPPGVCPRCI